MKTSIVSLFCGYPPGSSFCSNCNSKSNCPNVDDGPKEPDLSKFRGFNTEVPNIGNFTLSEFARMSVADFRVIDYTGEFSAEYFQGLQDEIQNLVLRLEA